jgi:hypothetical protein
MFFNPIKSKKELLQIEKDFVTLDEITSVVDHNNSIDPSGQQLNFTFSYKISQLQALEHNATSVRITIKKSNKTRPIILNSKKAGGTDPVDVVERILTHKKRIGLSNNSEEVIFTKISDISSRINNQLIDALRTGQTDLDSLGLKKQKIVLRTVQEVIENKLEENLIEQSTFRSKVDFEKKINRNVFKTIDKKQELYHKLLSSEIAPSSLDSVNNRFVSAFKNSRGISNRNNKEEYLDDYSNELSNFLLFEGVEKEKSFSEKDSQEIVTTLENVVDSSILIKTKVNLRLSSLSNSSNLIVNFELLKNKHLDSGERTVEVIQSIDRSFYPNEYISRYFYPTKAPSVSYSKSDHKIHFLIKQLDKRADTVKVYKKEINNSISSNYVYAGEIDIVESFGPMPFVVDHSYKEFSIYRFIPFSRKSKEFFPCQFTDVIVHEKQYSKHLVIVPRLTEEGITICAYNKDPMIQSAKLFIRNLSLKQKQYANTGRIFQFSNASSQSSTSINDLQENHIYEFSTVITLKSGVEIPSTHTARIEFLPYEAKALNLNITDTSLPGADDVQMTISATLQIDSSRQTRELLDSFAKNYEGNNSKVAAFNKLIYFNVIRHDVVTGEEADLGIIANGESFNDSIQSAKFNASQLRPDRSYKYVINAMVRDPESFRENAEVKDEISKKSYKFSPKQALHPLNLKRGIMKSITSIDKDAKHEALYGKIGFSYYFEYDRSLSKPYVDNFVARKQDQKIFLSWSVTGISTEIDHFIIMKESNRARTIIGKSHAIVSNIAYIHDITKDDIGENKYILVPVYSDFSTGIYSYSNSILVEESDVKV